ncbi:hypothetical protein LRB11_13215 [Ectothiorhodospira haloalkaliphila]|uniref:hypothetical protein n=1 Tax=Ectothiorhodospira haloalkaliphila TaxID=421628 RepID=UPI001EE99455|nr:hypothetical protein [Ectothiorhodospira haloalkaliphila]MCG5525881.1 hypothetical protein [Ectothiorhodospira haloalkaliphila]
MDKDDRLDEKTQKRLDHLSKGWEDGSSYLDNLTVADLRLMLEHFKPMRALIRNIAGGKLRHREEKWDMQADCAMPDQIEKATVQVQRLEAELAQAQKACRRATDERDNLAKINQELARKLDDLHSRHRESNQNASVVTALRCNSVLLECLGITLPEDDSAALIISVAVLSQRDNLVRLWDLLRDRSNDELRPIHEQERELLETALTWLNHNWKRLPYRLEEPMVGASFDFEHHQRAASTATGERIRAVFLPSLCATDGAPLRKALVQTE